MLFLSHTHRNAHPHTVHSLENALSLPLSHTHRNTHKTTTTTHTHMHASSPIHTHCTKLRKFNISITWIRGNEKKGTLLQGFIIFTWSKIIHNGLQFVLYHLSDNWWQNQDSDLVYNKQWNAVKRCAPANWKWRQMKEFVLTHDALNLYLEQCYK